MTVFARILMDYKGLRRCQFLQEFHCPPFHEVSKWVLSLTLLSVAKTRFTVIVALRRLKLIKQGLQALVTSDQMSSYHEDDNWKALHVKRMMLGGKKLTTFFLLPRSSMIYRDFHIWTNFSFTWIVKLHDWRGKTSNLQTKKGWYGFQYMYVSLGQKQISDISVQLIRYIQCNFFNLNIIFTYSINSGYIYDDLLNSISYQGYGFTYDSNSLTRYYSQEWLELG